MKQPKKAVKRHKIIKVAPLSAEVYPCYRFVCTNCTKQIEFKEGVSECFCREEYGQKKTLHPRGLCKKCTKKSKAV